jgi:Protein tyrosine and serine/threonine kinase
MSPEVAEDKPYNQAVDVYSFGILLWEMCAAEKPFDGYSAQKHMNQVVKGNERPKLDHSHTSCWPPNLIWLMKNCWSQYPVKRPTFTMIKQVLRDILCEKYTVPTSVLAIERRNSSSMSTVPKLVRSASPVTVAKHDLTSGDTKSVISTNRDEQSDETNGDDDPKQIQSIPYRKSSPLSPLSKQQHYNRRTISTPPGDTTDTTTLLPPINGAILAPMSPGYFTKPTKLKSTGRARSWGFSLTPKK